MFEEYINSFINSDLYPKTLMITYPATGAYGDNILADHITELFTTRGIELFYSMKADVPEGFSLKIVTKGGEHASWVSLMSLYATNWVSGGSDYDPNAGIQTDIFIVKESGKPADYSLGAYDPFDQNGQSMITDKSYITIEYYENGAVIPTKVKTMKLISSF